MCPWKWPEKSSSKALFLFNHGWKFSSSVSMEVWGWCFYNILFHLLPCFISACNYFHYWTNSSCEICTSIPRKKKQNKMRPWMMNNGKETFLNVVNTRSRFRCCWDWATTGHCAVTENETISGTWALNTAFIHCIIDFLRTSPAFLSMTISLHDPNKDLKTQLLMEVSINTETDCVSYGWDLCRTIFFSRVVYQSGLLSSKVRIGSN